MKIGSFSLIKELNTSVILNTIRKHKSISRAQIANITGLTPATVTNITAKLLDCRLISETTLGESSGGRKPVMLEINTSEYNVLCIAIGRHKTTISMYDIAGNRLATKTTDVMGISSDEALLKLSTFSEELIESSSKRVLGIGVSCEGMIDQKNGICVFSANLSWENVRIKEYLEDKLNIPVFTDNDVKVITLGEKWFGNGASTDSFVLFYTGYGIGLSVMNGGNLYRGSQNYAIEFGHTVIDAEGPVCSCGNKGCLQAFASGSALLRELHEKYGTEPTIEEIIKDSENDSDIYEIIKKQAYYIGIGAANAINIFNPTELILSGYVCMLNEDTRNIILNTINERILKSMKPNLKIVFSSLGEQAGNLGAAALTISKLYDTPSVFFGEGYDI